MPIPYLRQLTSKERSATANRHLARYLAFTAGATNAGGFLAVAQYTSHMTGIVSAMADHLALGEIALLLNGMGALLAFLFGAACSAVLIHWARRVRLQSEYAPPLLLQAGLLTGFGLLGGHLHDQLVLANRAKLRLLTSLVLLFFSGGVLGALGFKHLGFISTLPLAMLLLILAAVPMWDELRARLRSAND